MPGLSKRVIDLSGRVHRLEVLSYGAIDGLAAVGHATAGAPSHSLITHRHLLLNQPGYSD